jgi:hypothetical protein
MKEYEVVVNGCPLTLQLDDADAERWGVKEAVRPPKTHVDDLAVNRRRSRKALGHRVSNVPACPVP